MNGLRHFSSVILIATHKNCYLSAIAITPALSKGTEESTSKIISTLVSLYILSFMYILYRVKHQYSATIYIRTQLLVTYEEYLNT